MTIQLYTLPANKGCRAVRNYLEDNNIKFKEQNMKNRPLTWKQFIKILSLCEDGVNEILATRSDAYNHVTKELEINLEELPLSELYYIVKKLPSIIKAPITVNDKTIAIGYKEDEMSMWNHRDVKTSTFSDVLEKARKTENFIETRTKWDRMDIEEGVR